MSPVAAPASTVDELLRRVEREWDAVTESTASLRSRVAAIDEQLADLDHDLLAREQQRPAARLRRAAIPLLCAAAAVLAVSLLTGPHYSVNDDVVFHQWAAGTYSGQHETHLVFVNVLLGSLLAAAYTVVPAVPWYLVVLLALDTAAVAMLWRVVDRIRAADAVAALAVGIVAFSLALPAVAATTFTATALLLAGSAATLHLTTRPGPRSPGVATACGAAVVVAGLLRRDAALAGFAVVLPVGALISGRADLRRHATFVAVALGGLLLAGLVDGLAYRSPGWSDYREFNAVRGALHDTPRTTSASPEVLETIGWSPLDLALFNSWTFADPAVFTTSDLRAIADDTRWATGGASFGDALGGVLDDRWPALTVAALAALALAVGMPARRRLAAAAGLGGVVAIGSVLALYQRFPDRVAVPAIAVAAGAAVAALAGDRRRPAKRWMVLAAVPCVVIGATATLDQAQRGAEREQRLDVHMSVLETHDPDGVYVVPGASLAFEGIDPTRADGRAGEVEIIQLGWTTFSPPFERRRAGLGVDDLFADVGLSHIYLVAPEGQAAPLIQAFEQYRVEHDRGGGPELVVVARGGGIEVIGGTERPGDVGS